jgi:hypothetical protein
VDARDVDLTVTRMRRPRGPGSRLPGYATEGSAALAVQEAPERARRGRRTFNRAASRPATPAAPHLAVAPPAPVPVPRAPFVALVLLVVVGGVLGILLLNTRVNENAFILHDLRQEQAVLDQQQQRLEEQIAQADSPRQLELEARRLGLVRAGELTYLRLPDGVVVHEAPPGIEGPPAGGDPGSAPASPAADGSGEG